MNRFDNENPLKVKLREMLYQSNALNDIKATIRKEYVNYLQGRYERTLSVFIAEVGIETHASVLSETEIFEALKVQDWLEMIPSSPLPDGKRESISILDKIIQLLTQKHKSLSEEIKEHSGPSAGRREGLMTSLIKGFSNHTHPSQYLHIGNQMDYLTAYEDRLNELQSCLDLREAAISEKEKEYDDWKARKIKVLDEAEQARKSLAVEERNQHNQISSLNMLIDNQNAEINRLKTAVKSLTEKQLQNVSTQTVAAQPRHEPMISVEPTLTDSSKIIHKLRRNLEISKERIRLEQRNAFELQNKCNELNRIVEDQQKSLLVLGSNPNESRVEPFSQRVLKAIQGNKDQYVSTESAINLNRTSVAFPVKSTDSNLPFNTAISESSTSSNTFKLFYQRAKNEAFLKSQISSQQPLHSNFNLRDFNFDTYTDFKPASSAQLASTSLGRISVSSNNLHAPISITTSSQHTPPIVEPSSTKLNLHRTHHEYNAFALQSNGTNKQTSVYESTGTAQENSPLGSSTYALLLPDGNLVNYKHPFTNSNVNADGPQLESLPLQDVSIPNQNNVLSPNASETAEITDAPQQSASLVVEGRSLHESEPTTVTAELRLNDSCDMHRPDDTSIKVDSADIIDESNQSNQTTPIPPIEKDVEEISCSKLIECTRAKIKERKKHRIFNPQTTIVENDLTTTNSIHNVSKSDDSELQLPSTASIAAAAINIVEVESVQHTVNEDVAVQQARERARARRLIAQSPYSGSQQSLPHSDAEQVGVATTSELDRSECRSEGSLEEFNENSATENTEDDDIVW